MTRTRACALPEAAFLAKYALGDTYTDCFTADVPRQVSQAEYIDAFYTGTLFKIERFLLSWIIRKPSTDAQVRELAAGGRGAFAAWKVEERSEHQLLMCDLSGRTRSWLMSESQGTRGAQGTRLYFGSAVVPVRNETSGKVELGVTFAVLRGFHRMYSRALLSAARSCLERARPTP